jgi:hypothetical protein
VKQVQNTYKRPKLFSKSFKIGYNKELNKAQKTKICQTPNMRITDSRNKRADTVSKSIMKTQISKSNIRILRINITTNITNNCTRMSTSKLELDTCLFISWLQTYSCI